MFLECLQQQTSLSSKECRTHLFILLNKIIQGSLTSNSIKLFRVLRHHFDLCNKSFEFKGSSIQNIHELKNVHNKITGIQKSNFVCYKDVHFSSVVL